MKGARWVLLALIAAMLGGAGVTYVARKKALREQSPPRPRPLDSALSSSAPGGWHTVRSEGKRPVYQVDADSFTQSKDAQRIDLKGVRLRLYTRDASAYDNTVRCLGWRVFVCNDTELGLGEAVLAYREEYIVEHVFNRLRGKILGLTPLYLTSTTRIKGLIRLLSIGLRVLCLVEFTVRKALQEQAEKLDGIYAGNPKRATISPSS